MAGGSTDWGGLAIGVGVIGALYLAYSSGIFNRIAAGISTAPIGPGPGSGGYCSDGSSPSPQTGLCANGAAPTTIPVANPYPGQPGQGQPCTGQDMYTGQPCACMPPTTSSAMMMYGQMSAYQPSTPTCNCSMCGQGGGYATNPYGTQSPYGSPYGTQSPYGSPYGQQSPYGSPYGSQFPGQPGLGIGGIGQGLYPPQYPGYPYGPIGANYSPYPPYPYTPQTLGGFPSIGISPYPIGIATPTPFPILGGIGGIGGFPGGGIRRAYAGTSDLNGYAGAAIAADGFGF